MAERAMPERTDYPNNSHTARERAEEARKERTPPPKDDKPKVQKVVKGKVTQKKKSIGKRLAEAFGAREGQGIFDYILCDIIIPATKNMIIDSISDGVAMAFGEAPRRRRRSIDRRSRYDYDRVSYRDDDRRYDDRDRDRRRVREAAGVRDYENLSFNTKDDADAVISALVDMIDVYGQVSVLDLYEAAGVSAPDYAVGNYGWFKLGSASPRRIRDGYVLDLPRPVLL